MKRTKALSAMSFAAYDVERRTRKGSFYAQVDTIIDWKTISAIIDEHYQKGLSASGEKPYDGLLLFKMLLIGMWNNLSDVKVEEHVNDSLSAMKFRGMQLEDNVLIYSVLSRFRTEFIEKKAFDSLLSEINLQLEKHRIIIHQGVKVDASITQNSFHSKKPKTFEITQDRKEDELPEGEVEKQDHLFKEVAEDEVDKEARWLKKGTKIYFGYKKQIAVDSKTVWRGADAFKRLGQGTHATYFGSYCLQSESKSEDGNTSCLLMKKAQKKGDYNRPEKKTGKTIKKIILNFQKHFF